MSDNTVDTLTGLTKATKPQCSLNKMLKRELDIAQELVNA